MAPGKSAVDFNAIITADRQRRKNEALAKEIFGKGRRQSAPGLGMTNRKPGTGPSLASRVGIGKRTVSTTQKRAAVRSNLKQPAGNVNAEWTHDLHDLSNPSRNAQPRHAPKQAFLTRTERLYSAVNASASSPAINSQFNVVGSAKKPSRGLSIKGLAGPYIVMAKNFVQGTTAEDIESAMTPIGGVCMSCRLVTESPKVIAEIVFETKEGADNVVSTLNNQNADGNLLHVYHKVGPAAKLSNAQPAPITSKPHPKTPVGPRADTVADRSNDTRSGRGELDRYIPRSDRRGEYDSRDKVTDGSYGFDERMDTDHSDDKYEGKGGLYSDELVANRGRDNRTRGRGSERYRGFK